MSDILGAVCISWDESAQLWISIVSDPLQCTYFTSFGSSRSTSERLRLSFFFLGRTSDAERLLVTFSGFWFASHALPRQVHDGALGFLLTALTALASPWRLFHRLNETRQHAVTPSLRVPYLEPTELALTGDTLRSLSLTY
jgi:hypothetical protein